MQQHIKIVLALIVFLTACGEPATTVAAKSTPLMPTVNLISDPSFEGANPGINLSVRNTWAIAFSPLVFNAPVSPRQGSKVATFVTTGTNGALLQQINTASLIPGERYIFGGWFKPGTISPTGQHALTVLAGQDEGDLSEGSGAVFVDFAAGTVGYFDNALDGPGDEAKLITGFDFIEADINDNGNVWYNINFSFIATAAAAGKEPILVILVNAAPGTIYVDDVYMFTSPLVRQVEHPGPPRFEKTYQDDILGTPHARSEVMRDADGLLRRRDDIDTPSRDDLLESWTPPDSRQVEEP